MKRVAFAIIPVFLGLALSANSAFAQIAKDLVGTWQFVSAVITTPDGVKTDAFGPNPAGRLIFTPDGHYMILLLRNDIPKIASNNRAQATANENKALVLGSIGHFGTYSVSNKVITLKTEKSTFPNQDGTESQRSILVFTGNELNWGLAESTEGGAHGQNENDWKRIE